MEPDAPTPSSDPRQTRRPTAAAATGSLLAVVLPALAATSLGAQESVLGPTADDPNLAPPPAFREVLDDPRIAEAMVWDGAWSDGSGPRSYPRWDPERRAELHRWLAARERGEPGGPFVGGPSGAPTPADGGELPPQAAWRVFLAHTTHALWIERHREVPWSLRSLTPDQLGLLLDGRHLRVGAVPEPRDAFGPSAAVAAPSPALAFAFLRERDLLAASQEETVYSLADWLRGSVNGAPPHDLETALAAVAAPAAASPSGCRTLSALLAALLRSANIPVRVAESSFAVRGAEPVPHSRIELPTLGRGLVHSWELHAHLALPSGNAIPTAALFPTLGWIREHVEAPRHLECVEGACHTAAEQALFNSVQRLLGLAAIHLPDGLLIDRASDPSASAPPERLFHTLASGCSGRERPGFLRPVFEEAQRREIARRADEEIERAGGGDWVRGAETVRERWQRVMGSP